MKNKLKNDNIKLLKYENAIKKFLKWEVSVIMILQCKAKINNKTNNYIF